MIIDAGTRASPAIALASRERSPGRVRSTATTATHRSAPRIWVIMAAVRANSAAVKAAPRRGAPASARNRPAAEPLAAEGPRRPGERDAFIAEPLDVAEERGADERRAQRDSVEQRIAEERWAPGQHPP